MMTMAPSLRKFMLTSHVISSVGWAGALAVFLAHALASQVSDDQQLVRAACLMMAVTAWFVILPLSMASFVTGIVQALGSAWGLFRHYWVLIKLLLTAFATGVLLLKLAPISELSNAAAQATFSRTDLAGLKLSLLVHAAGGLAVLLVITVLAIYKPTGLTPYGIRKLQEQGVASLGNHAEVIEAPRWVTVLKVIAIVLLLLFVFMLLHGGHGPSAHLDG